MQPRSRLQNELTNYFNDGRFLRYAKGEIILNAGDEPPGVYLIQRGFIKVYSISDEGDENIHIIYKPGEVFPLIWAFKGLARNVFYQAISSCRLWILSTEDFRVLVDKSPAAAKAVINQLTDQFHVYADRLDNLEYEDAFERVIYRLLFLVGRFGVKSGRRVIIDAPITHQLIADSINLVRETVSRQIEELEKSKLVSHRGRKIVIEDAKALHKLIGEPLSLNRRQLL